MPQHQKYRHITTPQGFLSIDTMQLSSCSFFGAALQAYLFNRQHEITDFLENQQIYSVETR